MTREGGPSPEEAERARREGEAKSKLAKRLGWFVALWLGGVAALGLIATLIRSAIL